MFARSFARTIILAQVSIATSGCATITTGPTQNITVQTSPVGANCTLDRAGEILGVVTVSPATLNISKSGKAIEVLCRLDSYAETMQAVEPDFQAMTLGNVLIGGVIGIAVDAVSGAVGKYPEQVSVTMVPNSFGTIAERDAYFDKLQTRLADHARLVREWIAAHCQGADCQRRQAEAAQDEAELSARIAAQRQSATIKS